jgi:hypothetical protein
MWKTVMLIRKWIVAIQFRNVVLHCEEEKYWICMRVKCYENILTYERSLAIMGHAT